jgi:hypothetical protein
MRTAKVSDSCKKHFLVLYEKYQKAKKKNGPVIWANAVLCREYIQKIADPDNEADTFEEILAGSTTKEQAAESFRELCEESKSSPRKALLFPLLPDSQRNNAHSSLSGRKSKTWPNRLRTS